MMHDFLTNNRSELEQRCRIKVTQRPGRSATAKQLSNGVPMFLDQLIRTLQIEQSDDPSDSHKISGPSGGGAALSEVSTSAAQHGRALLSLGFSVDQVVHDYGDLCQAITDLAFERDAPFEVVEFRTLNRCLDNAIADAVTEFSYQRDAELSARQTAEATEKLGYFVHELRNSLGSATLAFSAAKAGNLPLSGATVAILERSLTALRVLIDRSLAEVRVAGATPMQAKVFSVGEFIEEIQAAGNLAAKVRGSIFTVSSVDTRLAIKGNRDLLFSAVWNLLQNAFKFTHADTEVTLNAYALADRILIDVKDHCGGLPPGTEENMFLPFAQHGMDKTGVGLGLSIARECVAADSGTLNVHDVPGVGCTFTISLPRHEILAA
jgi:signal transduction histidine kinase